MPRLSAEQVKALFPDPASLKAGYTLTDIRYWSNLGGDETALWGECQGSGREAYKICVDLADHATRCTCPSRKFPCKHGLGLMLLAAGSPSSLPVMKPPAWTAEWLGKRTERRITDTKPAVPEDTKPNPTGREKDAARRAAKRGKLAQAGIETLEQWLKDVARLGLAAAQAAPSTLWTDQAARLVDAQLPGAARIILEISTLPGSRPDWAEVLLLQLGQLYLLTQAYRHLDTYSFPAQQDILTLLGWNVNQKDLLATTSGMRDAWLVLASHTTEDEKTGLRSQVNWLYGKECQQTAQILNFAYRTQPLDTSFVPGLTLQGELVYFPSAYPLRAIFKDKQTAEGSFTAAGFPSMTAFLEEYAAALGKNPWLRQFPVVLNNVQPCLLGQKWLVRDVHNQALPIIPQFSQAWELLSVSGGHPVGLFGLWDGFYFTPLTVWAAERCIWL